jgi:hypothetical protein
VQQALNALKKGKADYVTIEFTNIPTNDLIKGLSKSLLFGRPGLAVTVPRPGLAAKGPGRCVALVGFPGCFTVRDFAKPRKEGERSGSSPGFRLKDLVQAEPDWSGGGSLSLVITRTGKIYLSTGVSGGNRGRSIAVRQGTIVRPSKPTDEEVSAFPAGWWMTTSYSVAGTSLAVTSTPSGQTAVEVGAGSGTGYTYSSTWGWPLN